MPDDSPSPSPSSSHLPARRTIDRAAIERVLRRAAELQAGAPEVAPEAELTEEQLLEVGREVGLSAEHLRQAIAEERTRVALPEEPGVIGRVVGPARAIASRTVHGTPDRTLAVLDDWMQREECLQVKRRYTDRLVWEARRDVIGSIKRGLRIGGRGYELTRAHDVAATVVPVDEARVLVRLEADLAEARSTRLRMGGLAVAGGFVTSGSLVVMGVVAGAMLAPVAALAAVPALAGIGAGYGVARRYAHAVTRVQLALEQVLDRLEYEGPSRPPSLLQLLTR